jgi:HlyD family secretion protein
MNEPGPRPLSRWWIAAAALVLALLLAAVAFRHSSSPPVPAAPAARRDLRVPITSDGTLEPPPGGEMRAADPATVTALLVAEGARVKKGTPLVQLSNPDLSQSALTARSGALALSEERQRAAADVDQLRRESDHRRRVFEADARLLKESAISRATYDSDELAWRDSQERLRQAQSRLESLGGSGGGRAELSAETARELQRRVSSLTIRAPADGIVYGLPRKAGETVAAGQIVASVADPEHLRVRTRVDEPDLPRIAVGQRMVVTFDGLPDRRWEGKVLSVPSGVTETGGRQVGEVVGEISDPRLTLPPNASVNVQIIVGEKRGALSIPRAAMLRDGEQRYVYVLEKGRARRRPVSVGLVGLSDVEITNGLSDNEIVLIPGAVALSEGMRVRVAKAGP